MFKDRRNAFRRRAIRRAEVVAAGWNAQVTLANLSASGAFIGTTKPPEIGSKLHLIEQHDGVPVHLVAEVRRTNAAGGFLPAGCGVRWQSARSASDAALRAFLTSIGLTDQVAIGADEHGRPQFEFPDEFASGDIATPTRTATESGSFPKPPPSSDIAELRANSSRRLTTGPTNAAVTEKKDEAKVEEQDNHRRSGRVTGRTETVTDAVFAAPPSQRRRFRSSGSFAGVRRPSQRIAAAKTEPRDTSHRISATFKPLAARPRADKPASRHTATMQAIPLPTGSGADQAASGSASTSAASGAPKEPPARAAFDSSTSASAADETRDGGLTASDRARRVTEEIAERRKELQRRRGTGSSPAQQTRRRSSASKPSIAASSGAQHRQEEYVTFTIRGVGGDGKVTMLTGDVLVMEMRRDPPRSIDDIELDMLSNEGPIGLVVRRQQARPTPTGSLVTCDIVKVDERGKTGIFGRYVKEWLGE